MESFLCTGVNWGNDWDSICDCLAFDLGLFALCNSMGMLGCLDLRRIYLIFAIQLISDTRIFVSTNHLRPALGLSDRWSSIYFC